MPAEALITLAALAPLAAALAALTERRPALRRAPVPASPPLRRSR